MTIFARALAVVSILLFAAWASAQLEPKIALTSQVCLFRSPRTLTVSHHFPSGTLPLELGMSPRRLEWG